MKTQHIIFPNPTPCFTNQGFGGMIPHTLNFDYEVSNLAIHEMNYITFDLYDEQGFIGHYIVFNVSLTKNDDGSMNATTTLPKVLNFEWNYLQGHVELI